MQMNPSTSMAAVPGTDFSGLANLMAMKGRGGDNTLVHMSKAELPYLNMLAKSAGYPQGLPVNPETGLPEANILKTILPVAGAILGGMFLPTALPAFLGSGALATGVGAGLGSFGGSLLSGKSLKDAAIGGLISGGLSGLGAATFGGQSFMGDTTSFANPAAAKVAADQAAQIAASNAGTTAANVTGAQISQAGQLGAFGMPEAAGGSDILSIGGPLGPANLGGSGSLIASAQNAINPLIPPTPSPADMALVKSQDAFLTLGTSAPYPGAELAKTPSAMEMFVEGPLTPATGPEPLSNLTKLYGAPTAAPVPTTQQIADAYVERGFFDKGFGPGDLREGYTPSAADLQAIKDAPSSSFLSFPKTYDPAGPLTRMDFLKTQLKPATTMGLAGVALDAATEQGAFEPIDYSSFPQAGEERSIAPLSTGVRFASRRTGAFPRTEEEALAFAQPGGTRQRFFDQGFFTPAKTGGGIATLEVKKFEDGGPGEGEGDDAGDDDGGVAGDAEGAAAGAPGPGDDAGTGDDSGGVAGDAEAAAAGAAAAAEAAEAAAAAEAEAFEAAFGAPMTTDVDEEDAPLAPAPPSVTALIGSIGKDPIGVPAPPTPPAPTNPNQVATPTDEMVGFGPMGRSDIASVLGGRSVHPGATPAGFQTDIGRGMFGTYASTDPTTAQSDVDMGYAPPGPVGSFSGKDAAKDALTTAMNFAVPFSGVAFDALTTPSGLGVMGAAANVANPDSFDTNTAATGFDSFDTGFSDFGNRDPEVIKRQREEESTIEMAQGGSFLEQMLTGGLAATDKAQDILGKLPKPITALLGGAGAPMLAEKFMGKPATDITAPPPPVRAMEAPVEAPPPPTVQELEEMQDIAVMQQVLSGVPVEAQAGGLISAYQMGGAPSPYFEGMVKGKGDGMSDSIPFTIEGTQPAILSRDEYVLPADIVSMMGNGSSDAGAEKIDAFINDFRVQKYGRGKQPPETRRGLSGVA